MSLIPNEAAERERAAFWDGVRVSLQTMPGLFAWGMVTGMAMVQAGLTIWQALLMTVTVYAGSAQLAVLPLIAASVPLGVIVFTGFMVNLRFVIFSAVIGPHFAHLPWYQRLWYGYFNVDVIMQTLGKTAGKVGYFKGLAMPNWTAWQVGTVAGILLASQIPGSWGIGFAGTVALLAITVPLVANRPTLIGVVVASIVSVMSVGLPYRLGLLVAMVLGIAAAVGADRLISQRASATPQDSSHE
jgi:predicted branched-subunit amino acid permease